MNDSQRPTHNSGRSARSTRVKFVGSVLTMIRADGHRQVRARIHQLSTSGGVVHLSDALQEAATVELMFRVGSTTLRAKAEMLAPMWSTKGFLQPFRFVALPDEQRRQLHDELERLLNSSRNSAHQRTDETNSLK